MEKLNIKIIHSYIKEIQTKILNQTYQPFEGRQEQILEAGKIIKPEVASRHSIEEITSSTISILRKIYGDNHPQIIEFIQNLDKAKNEHHKYLEILSLCFGKLKALEKEIKFNLITRDKKTSTTESAKISGKKRIFVSFSFDDSDKKTILQ